MWDQAKKLNVDVFIISKSLISTHRFFFTVMAFSGVENTKKLIHHPEWKS